MKARREVLAGLACSCALWQAGARAALPADWRHEQQFTVAAPGLVKFSLPTDTLDAARPALEDLRLYDDAGNEVPYLIERPAPAGRTVRNAKSFQVSLDAAETVVTLETGVALPLDAVTLATPAMNFIKAVRVEGSTDARKWQLLAQGQPVFRQASGASQLRVGFAPATWRWLRLTVDDQRSPPIPFTSAQVHAAAAEAAPGESQPAAIIDRSETPGQTRLTLNLGAANLAVASVSLDTDEPLFTRPVTVAAPQVSADSIREQVIGQGVIYRVAIEGQPASANLTVLLERTVPSRELVLLIRNEDSPPLNIRSASIERRPVHLVFLARQAGTFHLLTGNKSCAAPRYDLAAFDARLKSAAVAPARIPALADNPDYRAPEALSGLDVIGAPLDVSAWRFRKPVQLPRGGAQQIELDLDILAHARADFADLRVLRGGNQVPYIVERTSITRPLTLMVTAKNDAKDPKLSRWLIKLPHPGLPLTHLTCLAKTPLFQRQMSLAEERIDERGEKYRCALADATWTQTPGRKTREFSLPLGVAPQGDELILETQNGDNSPLELDHFTAFYPVSRVLFKAKADGAFFLYYGNSGVVAPSYDLSLVAGELLAADKASDTPGAEEQLRKAPWAETRNRGGGGVLFWGILAGVVVGLLVVISRLLPKTPPAGGDCSMKPSPPISVMPPAPAEQKQNEGRQGAEGPG